MAFSQTAQRRPSAQGEYAGDGWQNQVTLFYSPEKSRLN
jgi:hypothetical protein